MLGTPSFIPVYIFPIVVIGGCCPCVKKNSIIISVWASTMKLTFIQFTLDLPPRARPVATVTEWSHEAGLGFATWKVNVSVGWAKQLKQHPGWIWFGASQVCGPASMIWVINEIPLKFTRIFKDGSAWARQPAVTQAAAPPDLIVSTNLWLWLQFQSTHTSYKYDIINFCREWEREDCWHRMGSISMCINGDILNPQRHSSSLSTDVYTHSVSLLLCLQGCIIPIRY